MGLRNYVNDLKFSKEINSLPEGRWFENSDFARSVEITGKLAMAKDSELFCPISLLAATTFPLCALVIYGGMKHEKFKKSANYQFFSSSQELILNH